MLDIKFIRDNLDLVKQNAKNKKVDVDFDKLMKIDSERRALEREVGELRAQRNEGSKIKPDPEQITKLKKLSEKIKELEDQKKKVDEEYTELMRKTPNIVDADTPIGSSEKENKVVRQVGKIRKFDFKPKEHWEFDLDIIDIPRASRVSGARFGYLKGKLVLLEFALINLALSVATNEKILKKIAKKFKVSPKPFIPIIPPVLMKPEIMNKMGRLEPKEERYHIPSDNLYLVGSAEHTLGPMHMEETLEDLPIRYIGFSTAFRREAGSYGKDTKGIFRVHQFDKLEFESFTCPENGKAEQDFIIAIQEYLMQKLGIPYQVVLKCTGDMGIPDFREFDIEAWMPGQNKYRETHTSDYMTDFQSRRLEIKCKKGFVHMNDATVFAIGRTLIAIMENYQEKDGSIKVPKVLQKYCGFDTIK